MEFRYILARGHAINRKHRMMRINRSFWVYSYPIAIYTKYPIHAMLLRFLSVCIYLVERTINIDYSPNLPKCIEKMYHA